MNAIPTPRTRAGTTPGAARRRPTIARSATAATLTVLLAAGLSIADAGTAHAAVGPMPDRAVMVLAVNDLPTIVANLRNWVMGILAALATLFLTIGGARYLMAGGDPGEVERAKGAFRSAAVGYVLAVIAPVVLTVLNSIIGQ